MTQLLYGPMRNHNSKMHNTSFMLHDARKSKISSGMHENAKECKRPSDKKWALCRYQNSAVTSLDHKINWNDPRPGSYRYNFI